MTTTNQRVINGRVYTLVLVDEHHVELFVGNVSLVTTGPTTDFATVWQQLEQEGYLDD